MLEEAAWMGEFGVLGELDVADELVKLVLFVGLSCGLGCKLVGLVGSA